MISQNDKKGLRTWIEIDTNAVRKNYETFRNLIPKECRLMAVVKSNAYGHGLVDFSKEIVKCGADWLGVDSVVEGLALRREGITSPILVLGFTLPEMLDDAVSGDLSITVSSLSFLDVLKKEKLSKKLKVHLKIDTGMHRQGFLINEKQKVIDSLKSLSSHIEIEGLYTHFAVAKDPSSLDYTVAQIEEFDIWKNVLKAEGYSPIIHASATSGAILFPEARFDMVRVGVGLYGLWPSSKVKETFGSKFTLQPVLAWKTMIAEIKKLPKGSFIGYDLTMKLERDSIIAICPIGYWHGYSRSLTNRGTVLVKETVCKILGRVSMDMIVIDITNVQDPVVSDEVVIIGKSGGAEITAYEFADQTDPLSGSHYEAITRINPLIKKIYF